jgi:hypothetical protein
MGRVIALTLVAVLVIGVTVSFADNKRENRRFMHGFAVYAQGRIDHEQQIRETLRGFLEKNRGALKEGFAKHPEVLPEMYSETGIERINCISGRYYDTLLAGLNNEERHAFYGLAQKLSYWVLMMAIEEADRMKVYKPYPPLSFRRKTEIPEFIVEDLKREVWPYLQLSPVNGEGGLGFDDMTCDD